MDYQDNDQQPESVVTDLPQVGITKISISAPARNLADVLEEIAPEGRKVKVAEILNQEIKLLAANFIQGRLGPFVYCNAVTGEGELINFTTGGKVVCAKLAILQDYLPLMATIISVDGGANEYYLDIE